MSILSKNSHAAADLNARYGTADADTVLRVALTELFPERIAVVSSFGTEAAVLLHLVARIDRSIPIIFLDTLKHFEETLAYRDTLLRRLRLTDVRTIQPAATDLADQDPGGMLWYADADACCHIRKVVPLAEATMRFEALISGRKRHHGQARDTLDVFEDDGRHIKVNPLAAWRPEDVAAHFARYGLPAHPLVRQGYPSVGCAVCTSRVAPGDDFRAGRWRGSQKTECGIHTPARKA